MSVEFVERWNSLPAIQLAPVGTMADVEGAPLKVKSIYAFKGTNNDELNFNKGDVITVTQMPEGGWWEGTFRGVTGWFPSNYVKDFKIDSNSEQRNTQTHSRQDNVEIYRNVVLMEIIDSEKNHIGDLQNLRKSYLQPLYTSEILSPTEYQTLVGNLDEVIEGHLKLANAIEGCTEIPARQQRIGGAFIQWAPHLKKIHSIYCANHPKAVTILEKYRNELNGFVDSQGAATQGIRLLTSGLSKPFRRLEKYRGLLLELEHHMEESHVDRGDTQRAAHVFNNMAEYCTNLRKQKEIELEVLQGNIRGWEGEEVENLGDILLMSQLTMITEAHDRRDRHVILFPHTLVMLSVSPRMSAFVYEGKLPLAGINASRLEDDDNVKFAVEITGNMIDRIILLCHSSEEQDRWVEMLTQQICISRSSVVGSVKPPTLSAFHVPSSSLLVTSLENRSQSLMTKSPYNPSNQIWQNTCLRPQPPLRACDVLGYRDGKRTTGSRSTRLKEDSIEDDTRILKVIEAYCNSAKTRYTVNSTLLDSPQVLIAEEEKIINEVTTGNQTIIEEKSLVDTVYALKDQMKHLQSEMQSLIKALKDEQKNRKKIEEILKKCAIAGVDDVKWCD